MKIMKKKLILLALSLLATSQVQAGIEQDIVIFFHTKLYFLKFILWM